MSLRKHSSTLLLLAAVAVAGIVAYAVSRQPSSDELEKQRKRLFPGLATQDVRELTIQEGAEQLVCRRDGESEWRIVRPVDVRADRWEVESILDKLELAERVSSVYPEKGQALDAALYGLAEPVRTVTVKGSTRAWTMTVGREAGAGKAVFVAVEGREGVFAVPDDVVQKTAVTLSDLRSKTIAPRISAFDVQKVTLSAAALDERPARELECEKTGETWELKKPFHDLADEEEVRSLANKLYDHRIGSDEFVADDPTKAADYGLDEPALTLTLEGKEQTQTIVFSRREAEGKLQYYALHKGEPAIVRVPESLFNALDQDAAELRERRLADFRAEDAAELALRGPAGELRLQKEDEDWQIVGEAPVDADATVLGSLLRDLTEAEVKEFVADAADDLSPYGLTEERRTALEVLNEDGERLAELALGVDAATEGQVYAMRPPYPAVLAIERGDYVEKLLTGRLALLDRVVLEEPRDAAVRVATDGPKGAFVCARDEAGDGWRLTEPVTGDADRWAAQSIVGDFAHMRVLKFAAEQAEELAPYGLEEPEITVSVTYKAPAAAGATEGAAEAEDGHRARALRVGAPADEGRYARLADDARVFILPDYMVAHFSASLASKEICRASDLTALTFQRGEETRRFLYDGESRAWTDADGADLPEAAAEALKEAEWLLRSFNGADVADYVEKAAALYGFDEPYLIVELDEKTAKGKRVVIGKETEDGNRYAKGPVTGFVHVASAADVEKLTAVFEPTAPEGAAAAEPDETPEAEGADEPAEAPVEG
ncbi:MAG: hypothetical protein AMK73_00365 [Planctomycetes bacterium SM23_32]|nr:MAG: hypothetical protein AMK73_00365 [Planctomycetes bacterium SM23_32]